MNIHGYEPKILAVDDIPQNLFALEKLLQGVEAELIPASSGNEALKLTLKHDFGVAIVDVQMPAMDGYELVELMRGNKRTAHLPVIFISAVYSEDCHRLRGFRTGAVDFLSKPIIPEVLISKVKIFLNLNRQKMELERLVKELEEEIRQRRQAEEKQAQLLAAVESANRELQDFAHIVSHDLKAPLRAITNMVQFIVRDYSDKLDERGQMLADALTRNTHRMQALIDGVLEYSKIGRMEIEKSAVDLNRIAARAIDLILPSPHIEVVIEDELPTVWGDEIRFLQVLQNLIGNGVKFMDKPRGEIRIGCVEAGEYWQFRIMDNGPGIELDQRDRVFQIFQTLCPHEESSGTGIGLTVVKKIIETYGGRIWVESEIGSGSTFCFTIPRCLPDSGEKPNSQRSGNADPGPPK